MGRQRIRFGLSRRGVIAGFGAAAAWAAAAGPSHADPQPGRIYRLVITNVIDPANAAENSSKDYWRAVFQVLRQHGFVEGKNLVIDRRSVAETPASIAAAIARAPPDAVLAFGQMAKELARTSGKVPVVGTMGDPIGLKTVASLARPGGNLTGVSVDTGPENSAKRVELLRALVPGLSRIGHLSASGTISGQRYVDTLNGLLRATAHIETQLVTVDAPFDEEACRRAFAAIAEQHLDGLLVSSEAELVKSAPMIAQLANQARLPAIYGLRDYMTGGGLIAYALDYVELWRRLGEDLAAILGGTPAGDIPIYQPTKFLLIVNLKAVKALGLTVPTPLLATADEVIE